MPIQKINDRQHAIRRLGQAIKDSDALIDEVLWETIVLFSGHPFCTAKKLEFTYAVKGNEMFVSRKEKSITKATVLIAFHKALELGKAATGPKKLGTFGASYLYPVFVQIGVIPVSEDR